MLLELHSSCMVGLIGLKSKGNSMLTSAVVQNGLSTSGISIYILKAFKCFSFLIFYIRGRGKQDFASARNGSFLIFLSSLK